ncbi:MAG: DNA gyrase inhibitor YacG [Gammaproteobacteria bacterium]|nr:DNA gyrase inhibitor YacG [Gammaproteobacteria bacterium]MAY02275.1 DNA gyrase inhibitor YacG [Gammaproteobacteria bacterium]
MKNTSNSAPEKITEIACPQCGKSVPWKEEQRYRPFCSKRCQMIDFGDWANERNTIPLEDPPDWDETQD